MVLGILLVRLFDSFAQERKTFFSPYNYNLYLAKNKSKVAYFSI